MGDLEQSVSELSGEMQSAVFLNMWINAVDGLWIAVGSTMCVLAFFGMTAGG